MTPSTTTPARENKAQNISGVQVFSATRSHERETLGERVTDWIRDHPDHEIVDKIVTQSSDAAFHCVTLTLFYRLKKT